MKTLGWVMILLSLILIRMGWKGQIVDETGNVIVFDNLEKIITGLILNDTKMIREGANGTSSGLNTPVDTTSSFDSDGGYAGGGSSGGGGGSWSFLLNGNDNPAAWDKLNPNTVNEAVEWALSRKTFPTGMCERMVTLAYGYAGGYPTARAHADAMQLHTGTPPKGALVFHATRNPAQHVCLSIGGGYVVSTDFDGTSFKAGAMSAGPLSAINKWGTFRGWSAPVFKK